MSMIRIAELEGWSAKLDDDGMMAFTASFSFECRHCGKTLMEPRKITRKQKLEGPSELGEILRDMADAIEEFAEKWGEHECKQ